MQCLSVLGAHQSHLCLPGSHRPGLPGIVPGHPVPPPGRYVVACIRTPFACLNNLHGWVDHLLYTHSSVDGLSGRFYFLAIVSSTTVPTRV